MLSLTILVVSIGLFLLRVPVSIAIGIATLVGFLMSGIPATVMATRMIQGVDSFALLAVPFFILAGNLMNAGGITERIFAFARATFGWITGGLAQVNILASVIFAGMSGSALADLAGLGAVEIRAMRTNGYPVGFSAAVTLASCTIGPLIPPSIILVIYGLATNTSIGQLFLGGALAGLVVAAALMVFVYLYVRLTRAEWAQPEPFVIRNVFRTAIYGAPGPVRPRRHPRLAGASASRRPRSSAPSPPPTRCWSGCFYRQLTWRKLRHAFVNTVVMTSVIMYLFAVATAMNFIVARERVAHRAAEMMAAHITSPFVGILLVNLFLIVVGMFLEGPVAILIIAPILLDVVRAFGMGPVQFGVMLSFNLLVGMITPPMGIGLFVGAKVAGISPEAVLRASLPFFIPLIAGLLDHLVRPGSHQLAAESRLYALIPGIVRTAAPALSLSTISLLAVPRGCTKRVSIGESAAGASGSAPSERPRTWSMTCTNVTAFSSVAPGARRGAARRSLLSTLPTRKSWVASPRPGPPISTTRLPRPKRASPPGAPRRPGRAQACCAPSPGSFARVPRKRRWRFRAKRESR